MGIFSRFGRFDHLMTFLAVSHRSRSLVTSQSVSQYSYQIAHIQVEWLIMTYLLGYSFTQGYINASIVGAILCFGDLYFVSIRPGFALTSILGG